MSVLLKFGDLGRAWELSRNDSFCQSKPQSEADAIVQIVKSIMTPIIHRRKLNGILKLTTVKAMATVGVVFPQLWGVDFCQQAMHLKVPVYFLMGRHDVTTSPKLTEEYFNLLSAPHKELIWFEHSGHGSWMNEPAKFIDVMVNKVLAQDIIAKADTYSPTVLSNTFKT
jgi:pimeloyl-ACP methyl ester carboxylesterase